MATELEVKRWIAKRKVALTKGVYNAKQWCQADLPSDQPVQSARKVNEILTGRIKGLIDDDVTP